MMKKIRQKIRNRKEIPAEIIEVDNTIKSKVKKFIETKFVGHDILKKTYNIV